MNTLMQKISDLTAELGELMRLSTESKFRLAVPTLEGGTPIMKRFEVTAPELNAFTLCRVIAVDHFNYELAWDYYHIMSDSEKVFEEGNAQKEEIKRILKASV